jgi:hypothetical protein
MQSFAFAADVAKFDVQVSPSKASVNQSVDLKIRALDSNGSVVKDYSNSIYIAVLEVEDFQDVIAP